MKMELYRVVNRELKHVKSVTVPEGTVDFDSWLFNNGYSREHTLRRGIVTEPNAAELRALHRAHDRLKAMGKLPSAAWTIKSALK